jgi:hypothetical protein
MVHAPRANAVIHLGLDDAAKGEIITRYREEHGIKKVYVLSPARFAPSWAAEHMTDPATQGDGRGGLYLDWPNLIQYRYYYRLLQEIDGSTLVVVNECLRTQNRHDLTYNCIRNYLNQTPHVLVFQYLPIIDTIEDFMVLLDFATQSRWKREAFRQDLLGEAKVHVAHASLSIEPVRVPVDDKTRAAYAKEKVDLLADMRSDPDKDPHQIPRNLLLVSGKAKLSHVDPSRRYVGRNNRFKLPNLETYRDAAGHGERVALELPHNFIDMADLLTVSRQHRIEAIVADTKAEDWYLSRFQNWIGRVNDAAATLHG